ncbi:MAG: manganese efflux pump [Solirubrobacteraceae bacterium]
MGILAGDYLGEKIGSRADYIGAATLAVYGLYLIVEALRTPAPEKGLDYKFALFGLPLQLSVDNVVAGTSLGLLGYYPGSRRRCSASPRRWCRWPGCSSAGSSAT